MRGVPEITLDVAEFNLLCVAFNTVAERHQLYVSGEAIRIINYHLDAAVRQAVMAFAAQQALIRCFHRRRHANGLVNTCLFAVLVVKRHGRFVVLS